MGGGQTPFTVSKEGENKLMHDIEYNKNEGNLFLDMHDHPELYKHFVLPVADTTGILFYITQEKLLTEDEKGSRYGYSSVPGFYGVGDYSYYAGAIHVNHEPSLWERIRGWTFDERCDAAVKRLEGVCDCLDITDDVWCRDYLAAVDRAKRYRIHKLSVPKGMCPRHND